MTGTLGRIKSFGHWFKCRPRVKTCGGCGVKAPCWWLSGPWSTRSARTWLSTEPSDIRWLCIGCLPKTPRAS